jgi:hypothetical protein
MHARKINQGTAVKNKIDDEYEHYITFAIIALPEPVDGVNVDPLECSGG